MNSSALDGSGMAAPEEPKSRVPYVAARPRTVGATMTNKYHFGCARHCLRLERIRRIPLRPTQTPTIRKRATSGPYGKTGKSSDPRGTTHHVQAYVSRK